MTFDDISGVLRLDKKHMTKLSKTASATKWATYIILLASLVGGAASFGYEFVRGAFDLLAYGATPFEQTMVIVSGIILSAAVTLLGTWILSGLYRLGARMLGGKGSVEEIFRVLGHRSVLSAVSWIPFISFAFLVYAVIIDIHAIMAVEKLSQGRATGAFFIGIGILLAIIVVLAIIIAAIMMASGAGVPSASL